MKNWVMPYLKELMPDPVLRLSYERRANFPNIPILGFKYFFDDAPCDDLKEDIYKDITILSGLVDPDSCELRSKDHCMFIVHYDFTDPQTVDAGLHLYEHTSDYLRWLLDRMIEEEFHEGIVLVLHRLEEIGVQDMKNRFDL